MDYKQKWVATNSLPPLHISSGTMEAIKWLALIAMTIDHTNQFLFNSTIHTAYCIGRLAMPLFAFIFAYNLARPDSYSRGLYNQVIMRLCFFGVVATPAYMAMLHLTGLLPLNILFMLAAAAASLYFCTKGGSEGYFIAFAIFLLSGPFVDYFWIGIFFCFTCWVYCRSPSVSSLLLWLLAYFLLGSLNDNQWGLFSLGIIIAGSQMDIKIPRIRHIFYYYYPIHLYILYLLSRYFQHGT